MKIYKRKNFIYFLLSICFVISWLSFGVSDSHAVSSHSTSDESYISYSINDALPASVSGKIENLNSSFYSRARSNANSSLGLRVLFALVVCIFTGCCFTYFSSFLTSDAHSNSSSHSIVLDYIHKQDGKK